jgi:hypothetical protein
MYVYIYIYILNLQYIYIYIYIYVYNIYIYIYMYNIHIHIHTYINIHINRGVKLVAAPGQTAGRAQAAGGESADSAHRNSRAQERHVHHLCKRTHSIYRENTFYHRLYTTYTTYVHHLCKRTHSIYREHILSPDAPLFFLPLFSWFPLR